MARAKIGSENKRSSSANATPSFVERKGQNNIPRLVAVPDAAQKVTCTFHQFFAVWAAMQEPKWQIPDLHIDILDFLSNHKDWENNTGLLQVFRGAAKSTIVGLFVVWMLSQNPTLRFLILSADKKTAVKITTDVSSIIARHPLAKHLFDKDCINRQDTVTVHGATDGRTASVTSWGIQSNITGARADWIIYDDVEVPKNSATELMREQLRAKLDEPTHILVPNGYELFVGTPHSFDSIYTELEGVSEKAEPFRTGCTSLKIPVMSNVVGEFPHLDGEPVWPERFSLDEIKKRQMGSSTKGHFLSQYLLLPYNPADTLLDPTLIALYRDDIKIHAANGGVLAMIGQHRIMGASVFWDPAMSKLGTDDSVLAIVFTSEDGHYFIHRVRKLTGDAQEQCAEIISFMKANEVSHLHIETNGIGAFLPPIFRKCAEGSGITCDGEATNQNKIEKIIHAYEGRLASGYLHAHVSVMDTPFRTQLRDFNSKTANKAKDDFIDAVAMAILKQPIRIRAGAFGTRSNQWQSMANGGTVEVPMDEVAFR